MKTNHRAPGLESRVAESRTFFSEKPRALYQALSFGLIILGAVILSGCSAVTGTGTGTKQGITVHKAWVDHTEAGSNAVVLAMVIHNRSDYDDRLLSVTSDVSEKVEIHGYQLRDGQEVMVPFAELKVRSDELVRLKRGKYHLMLTDLKKELKVGDQITLTLTFDKAGRLHMVVPIAHSENSNKKRKKGNRHSGGR